MGVPLTISCDQPNQPSCLFFCVGKETSVVVPSVTAKSTHGLGFIDRMRIGIGRPHSIVIDRMRTGRMRIGIEIDVYSDADWSWRPMRRGRGVDTETVKTPMISGR